jgi:hypothetical protein
MGQLQDRLKKAQRGNAGNAPRLNIVKQLEIRVNDGKPAFHWYNPETKEDEYTTESIGGVFINAAIKITAFDRYLLAKGGTCFTSLYFSNADNVVLFEPTATGVKKVMTGTPIAIKEKLATIPGVQAKVSRILFILNESGLLAIKTNISIAIDQMKKYETDLGEKMIILTPTEYDINDPDISKVCKEKHLGALAATNKPKYAKITMGDALDEDILESLNVIDVIDNFTAWREYKGINPNTEDDTAIEAAAAKKGPEPMPTGHKADYSPDLPPEGQFADNPPY